MRGFDEHLDNYGDPDPPSWTAMRRSDFDAAEPLTLFDRPDRSAEPRQADPLGTPDMFADLGGDPQ